jgi:hypothetical protein
MKHFEFPEIEIVKLEVEDVINSSLVLDNMGEWDGLE